MLAALLITAVAAAAAPAAQPSSGADWLQLRERTILTVWPDGGGSLPTAKQPTSTISNYKGFKDLTQLVWNLSCPYFSLNSTVYHSVRDADAGRLSDDIIIHHHGHATACDKTLPESRCDSNRSFYDFYNVTDFYHRVLKADAYFHYMPLYGPNEQQGFPVRHAWFEQWQQKGVPTIKFFLEPVVRTINLALSRGYKRVIMIGKSGGGWTTTLSAALDARIALSFPIAGSIPLDFHHKSWDYEQIPRPGDKLWYLGVANYTRLYALAAIDANGTRDTRASLQVLHERDPCCFYGLGRHERIKAYDAAVSAALAPLPAARRGGVAFSTAITNWSLHAICQMDRVVIGRAKAQFDDHHERPFDKLPCDVLRSASLPCPYAPNVASDGSVRDAWRVAGERL